MNSTMKVLLILVAAALLLSCSFGGCIYSNYNRANRLDEQVDSRWAEVENQLQRRFELTDNLVATVKGLAGQEEKIFLGVAEARKAYTQARTQEEKVHAGSVFESALSRLLVIQERYPELKSNEAFIGLQAQLEGTENRLAVARMNYNRAVQELNTFARHIIGRIACSLAGVDTAEYFEITEEAKEVPKVDFSEPNSG